MFNKKLKKQILALEGTTKIYQKTAEMWQGNYNYLKNKQVEQFKGSDSGRQVVIATKDTIAFLRELGHVDYEGIEYTPGGERHWMTPHEARKANLSEIVGRGRKGSAVVAEDSVA